MKSRILLFLLIGTSFSSFGQSDSIPVGERVRDSELSKSDLISKGRRLLLKDLETGNTKEAKEVMDYLAYDVADEEHLAVWPGEQLMLYFWTGSYQDILNWVMYMNVDSLTRYQPAITPSRDALSLKLEERLRIEYDDILADIDSMSFTKDTNDFLVLFLDRLLVSDDSNISIDDINNRADAFMKEYSGSPLTKVVRETITYKLGAGDWMVNMSLGGGVPFITGNITDYIRFNQGFITFSIDAYYKKFYFGLNVNGIDGKARQDIEIRGKDRIWYSRESVPVSMIAPIMGYKVAGYKHLQLTPFAGISFNRAVPYDADIKDNPDLKGLSLGTSVSPLVGMNLDFLFRDFNKIKPEPYFLGGVNFSLGIKAMYSPRIITTQGGKMDGNVFMLGLHLKMYLFQVKRIY